MWPTDKADSLAASNTALVKEFVLKCKLYLLITEICDGNNDFSFLSLHCFFLDGQRSLRREIRWTR